MKKSTRKQKRPLLAILILAVILLVLSVISIGFGALYISPDAVVTNLLGMDHSFEFIIQQYRLPALYWRFWQAPDWPLPEPFCRVSSEIPLRLLTLSEFQKGPDWPPWPLFSFSLSLRSTCCRSPHLPEQPLLR